VEDKKQSIAKQLHFSFRRSLSRHPAGLPHWEASCTSQCSHLTIISNNLKNDVLKWSQILEYWENRQWHNSITIHPENTYFLWSSCRHFTESSIYFEDVNTSLYDQKTSLFFLVAPEILTSTERSTGNHTPFPGNSYPLPPTCRQPHLRPKDAQSSMTWSERVDEPGNLSNKEIPWLEKNCNWTNNSKLEKICTWVRGKSIT